MKASRRRSRGGTIGLSRAALCGSTKPPATSCADRLELTVAGRFARVGREVRLVVPPSAALAAPRRDAGLIKLIVKAHAARMALLAGEGRAVADIAREQGHAKDYFTVLLRIAHLGPEVVAAILEGRQPQGLTRRVSLQLKMLSRAA